MTYRPEIDGLRALAILPVVFFHFDVEALGGGFVGVDVFFVISGYLITNIILRELDRGEFTFKAFYARRARRILPASLALLTATALFGWLGLRPTDLVVLGKSIVATIFFASNFFFLGQADYFGADGKTLHLLHTWCLAVEEQFYFLLPLFLFALRRLPRSRLFWIVVATAGVSLLLSLVQTRDVPALAFYLLPSRAWELLIGALVAIRPPDLARPAPLPSLLTLSGIALIGASIFSYDSDTPFPGIAAAAPTLGAALTIAASPRAARWIRWPLTNPAMVGIGKISYSMYLWHWPMAVVYRSGFKGRPELAPLLFLGLLPISYLSYRFIEQPFRRPTFLTPRLKTALAVSASLALATFGFVAVQSHGMFFGLDAYVASIADAPRRWDRADSGGDCFSKPNTPWDEFPIAKCLQSKPGRRSVLLWGDSVAAHHFIGLQAAAHGTNIDILEATMGGCPPALGLIRKNRNGPICKARNDAVIDFVKNHPPSLVLLGGEWRSHPDTYQAHLSTSLMFLRALGLRVIVLGPAIEYARPLPELIVQHLVAGRKLSTPGLIDEQTLKIERDLKNGAVKLSGARLVSLFDLLCSDWNCPTLTPEGSPVQWDTHHLTRDGSLLVGRELFPVIEAELGKEPPPGTDSARMQIFAAPGGLFAVRP
jgi:peptidoglycan/LPS O-acetylase OafA/YrhL